MAECRDLHTHGDYMPGAIDFSSCSAFGKATAIDSLAAVKHLIFDTKTLTWDKLLTAIEANWEGHEAVRQLCLNAPKYGNGIEWVDAIGLEMETFLLEFLHQHPKPHDQAFQMRQIPITFHVPMGKVTWATPNGRPAHEYLSEGISASHGRDVKGPTVALNSMARGRNLSYREKEGDLINLKFSPASVAGEDGHPSPDADHPHLVRPEALARAVQHPEQGDAAGGTAGPGEVPEPDRAHCRLLRLLRGSLPRRSSWRSSIGRKSTCSERAAARPLAITF